MAQCPECQENVPYSAMLRAGGLAGIVCPRCNTELEAVVWTQVAAFAIAILLSTAAANALRGLGLPQGWKLTVQIATFIVLSMFAWVVLVRLRRRKDRSHTLGRL